MTVYPVCCPECGWFGMSDDCKYGRCPWCGGRVRKETEGEDE
jgi:predicted Zn-ribbon and HTH transcriptional regulator